MKCLVFCDLFPGSDVFFDQQGYNRVTKGGRLDISFVKIGQDFPDFSFSAFITLRSKSHAILYVATYIHPNYL